ncbi:MAG TPA: hypothetical protein VMO47_07790 [Rhodothermales bacterium]|nr:hypothetical protein [Rhodothermales bacterium]
MLSEQLGFPIVSARGCHDDHPAWLVRMKRLGVLVAILLSATAVSCDLFSDDNDDLSLGEPIPGTEQHVEGDDDTPVLQFNAYPRISPDGKTLAYRWFDGTLGGSIYLRDLASSEVRFLVQGIQFDWSPDSRWLVFASSGHNLGKITREGDSLFQLTHGGGRLDPSWSPDGGTIAHYVETGDEHTAGIATVTSDGEVGPRLFLGGMPDWFPDGRLFASLGRIDAFLVYDWPTARLDTITGIPDQVRGPQVSLDGKRITFWARGIWICNSDGSGLRLIIRDDASKWGRGDNPEFRVGAPSWHPDGRHIIFEHLRIAETTYRAVGRVVAGSYSIRMVDVGAP